MTSIEVFGWTLSNILGIIFIISLVALSRKPSTKKKMTQFYD
ncbi:hypothetical protein PB1_16299 [Bacillus methanolicus PB1]|uniref:Uncharacterized protein n=1 Tax=Bacillus methanolicus PB1 TaxID=997296 RepID=I3DY14_BACMT|nr:hypothetical protein [Bacillus methanolicus]EIJ79135.1 hypothetical protein PB1_16299 [Bacillus methanolicus PB1]